MRLRHLKWACFLVRVAGVEPTASWTRSPVGKSKRLFRLRLAVFPAEEEACVSCSLRCVRPDFFCRGSSCGSGGEGRADILLNPRFFFLHVCPGNAGHFLNKMPFLRSGGIIADSKLSAYVEQQIRIFDILFGRQDKVTSGLFCKGVHFNQRVFHLCTFIPHL